MTLAFASFALSAFEAPSATAQSPSCKGSVCLDTPAPWVVPQVIQFRAPSEATIHYVEWLQPDHSGLGHDLTLIEQGPPGGQSTYQFVFPTQSPNGRVVYDADTDVRIFGHTAQGNLLSADFIVPVQSCLGNPSVTAKKKRGTLSFDARCPLTAELTVTVIAKRNQVLSETSGQAQASDGPASVDVAAKKVKKCLREYRKCTVRAVASATTVFQGITYFLGEFKEEWIKKSKRP